MVSPPGSASSHRRLADIVGERSTREAFSVANAEKRVSEHHVQFSLKIELKEDPVES
jgi:hypothetical protein